MLDWSKQIPKLSAESDYFCLCTKFDQLKNAYHQFHIVTN